MGVVKYLGVYKGLAQMLGVHRAPHMVLNTLPRSYHLYYKTNYITLLSQELPETNNIRVLIVLAQACKR